MRLLVTTSHFPSNKSACRSSSKSLRRNRSMSLRHSAWQRRPYGFHAVNWDQTGDKSLHFLYCVAMSGKEGPAGSECSQETAHTSSALVCMLSCSTPPIQSTKLSTQCVSQHARSSIGLPRGGDTMQGQLPMELVGPHQLCQRLSDTRGSHHDAVLIHQYMSQGGNGRSMRPPWQQPGCASTPQRTACPE